VPFPWNETFFDDVLSACFRGIEGPAQVSIQYPRHIARLARMNIGAAWVQLTGSILPTENLLNSMYWYVSGKSSRTYRSPESSLPVFREKLRSSTAVPSG
jgi:hypothetical protein